MRKLFVFLCVSCLVLLSSSNLFAGGVDNRSNLSGEYVGSLNRNAVTDSLDAIAYNPAGVMKMEDGTYGNFSLHYVAKDYTNIVAGDKLEQDKASIVPALFALYKKDKWAGFFSLTIPSGGGKVDYKNGSATTRTAALGYMGFINQSMGSAVYNGIENERLNAESVYYGLTFGGAYKINEIISVSLSGRYIDANKKLNGTFQLVSGVGAPTVSAVGDLEDNADGFGFIIGLGIDSGPLYIGMRYEAETDLDFKYSVKEDSIGPLPGLPPLLASRGWIDGVKHARNLPAVYSLGFAYTATPKVKIDAGLTYYFQENADWNGAEQNVDDGHEMGFSVEYAFRENLKGTIGYLRTETGMDPQYALNENPELDATSYGLGIKYEYNENLKMNFGLGIVSYKRDSYMDSITGLTVVLDKEVKMFSAGAEYRF